MFRNYFTTAWRKLVRHKFFTFVHLFGLSVGLAGFILMLGYVEYERSWDADVPDADRIYRAWVEETEDGRLIRYSTTSLALAPAIKASIPQVEKVGRVHSVGTTIRYGGEVFDSRLSLAEPEIFSMMDFQVIQGGFETYPERSDALVVTKSFAEKYLKDTPALGTVIELLTPRGRYQPFEVIAVVADLPANRSVQGDMFTSFGAVLHFNSEGALTNWFQIVTETYLQLKEGVNASELTDSFQAMMAGQLPDLREGNGILIHLQPLREIHLDLSVPVGNVPVSDPLYSWIMLGMGCLLLSIACVNFTTMSLAQGATRAAEVGLRKVIGATPSALRAQFLGESLLVCGVAAVLALAFSEALLPWFNSLAGIHLELNLSLGYFLFLWALVMALALVTGGYPALLLSRLAPVESIKGQVTLQPGRRSGRVLVIGQYAASAFLLLMSMVLLAQIDHMKTRGLGYDKEGSLLVYTNATRPEALKILDVLRQELSGNPAIEGTALTSYSFGDSGWLKVGFRDADDRFVQFTMNEVDANYIPTFGIELVAGRNFVSGSIADSTSGLIINEAMAQMLSLDAPLGKTLPGSRFGPHEIIGVVKNFHIESLHHEIGPLALVMDRSFVMEGINDITSRANAAPKLVLKYADGAAGAVLSAVQARWEQISGNRPLRYTFTDEAVQRQYQLEERMGRIATAASALALLVAVLGLFAHSAISVVRRRKEIGIRKVLGADVAKIVWIFLAESGKTLLLGFSVALPVAWYAASQWLESYPFRVDFGLGVVLLPLMLLAVPSALAVLMQVWKAATVNPVNILRNNQS